MINYKNKVGVFFLKNYLIMIYDLCIKSFFRFKYNFNSYICYTKQIYFTLDEEEIQNGVC